MDRELGYDHPDTIITLHNLSELLIKEKEREEEGKMLKKEIVDRVKLKETRQRDANLQGGNANSPSYPQSPFSPQSPTHPPPGTIQVDQFKPKKV